jgi:hypothetical protein
MASSHIFINLLFVLSDARTELGTCDDSLEIDVSGFLTAIDPSASPNGRELDDRRVADDSSGFALSE